jgi:hypothetical protein
MTAKKSKLGVTWHNLTPPRHPASRREPVRHTRPFRANASKSRGSLTNRVYLTLRVFKRDIASSRALSTEVIPAPCLTLFWRPRSMQLWGDRRIGAQSRTGARHAPRWRLIRAPLARRGGGSRLTRIGAPTAHSRSMLSAVTRALPPIVIWIGPFDPFGQGRPTLTSSCRPPSLSRLATDNIGSPRTAFGRCAKMTVMGTAEVAVIYGSL